MGRRGLDLCGSEKGHVVECRDHGNELSGTLKCGEFLVKLRTCFFFKGACCRELILSNSSCNGERV
jgi:hypothetical protein